MSHSLKPARSIDTLAFRLRRFQPVHRVGRWVRRDLLGAVAAGFWAFVRYLFARSRRFGPPAKTFSAYQALRSGWPELRGRIILHDQGVPKVSADSLLARSGLEQHAEQPWPIFWSEHTDARLITQSLALVTPEKTLCVESAYNEKRWRDDTASRYLKLPPPVRLAGNWTSIVSHWTPSDGVPVYAHWLHDALPRLALLPEFPPDTRILVPPNLAPYQIESLEVLGLWPRCRPTAERHIEVENYFFSSPVSMIDCHNPYAVNFLRTAFLPRRDKSYSGPKKFYYQRTSKRRSIENADEIAEFFRARGWAVVRDVDLTFAQTVQLFAEAEAVCSICGSNMSNVLFCPPGCFVLHLVPDIAMDGWVDWIAQVANLNYHFLVIPSGGPLAAQVVVDIKLIGQFFDDNKISV